MPPRPCPGGCLAPSPPGPLPGLPGTPPVPRPPATQCSGHRTRAVTHRPSRWPVAWEPGPRQVLSACSAATVTPSLGPPTGPGGMRVLVAGSRFQPSLRVWEASVCDPPTGPLPPSRQLAHLALRAGGHLLSSCPPPRLTPELQARVSGQARGLRWEAPDCSTRLTCRGPGGVRTSAGALSLV